MAKAAVRKGGQTLPARSRIAVDAHVLAQTLDGAAPKFARRFRRAPQRTADFREGPALAAAELEHLAVQGRQALQRGIEIVAQLLSNKLLTNGLAHDQGRTWVDGAGQMIA